MSSSCSLLVSAVLAASLSLLLPQPAIAQIPTACTDQESLENLVCCPTTEDGVCGATANRGQCVSLNLPNYSRETSDVRRNWPHYFTQACQCNGNYGGYDCSRCRFGYFGSDCRRRRVLPRRPVRELTDEDWIAFLDIIRGTRTYDSGYRVVMEESPPGNASLVMTNVSLYQLYVWVHHYSAKDSMHPDPAQQIDYAHTGPAFYTWHRLLNLWLEWQIQGMLQSMGRRDYHTFRLPYWDWRAEVQRSFGVSSEELFSENRLGVTRNVSGFPRVFGTLIEGGWDTICFQQLLRICDPRVSTGPLQRCPFTGTDPCSSSNPQWPTVQDVTDAIRIDEYDAPPYNLFTRDGFRSFVDFEVGDPTDLSDVEECRNTRTCSCVPVGGPDCIPEGGFLGPPLTAHMHLLGHHIPGIGDFASNATLPDDMKGQIEDIAASPNDPLFIVHHTMIDCMLDEWLQRHSDAEYPVDPQVTQGHRRDDFVTPLFPLYTNGELFKRTREFGYSCRIAQILDCPNPVECLVDPCRDAECPRFPSARCEVDACHGECRATFIRGQKNIDVTARCGDFTPCQVKVCPSRRVCVEELTPAVCPDDTPNCTQTARARCVLPPRPPAPTSCDEVTCEEGERCLFRARTGGRSPVVRCVPAP